MSKLEFYPRRGPSLSASCYSHKVTALETSYKQDLSLCNPRTSHQTKPTRQAPAVLLQETESLDQQKVQDPGSRICLFLLKTSLRVGHQILLQMLQMFCKFLHVWRKGCFMQHIKLVWVHIKILLHEGADCNGKETLLLGHHPNES